MPNPYQFTIDQELQFFTELQNINMRNERFQQIVTPDLAANVGNLAYIAPGAPKEVLMTAGRAVTDNILLPEQAEELVSETERKVLSSPLTYKFDGGNFFGNIWDQLFEGGKSTVKWGLAGIQLPADALRIAGGSAIGGAIQTYQSVTGAPGQISQNIIEGGSIIPDMRVIPSGGGMPGAEYIGTPDIPQPGGLVRGAPFVPPNYDSVGLGTIIRSTELGALLTGADSGNGFFIGQEAKRLQMENMAKLTGTLNGEPIQPGTIALAVSRPGTKPYAILSSLINLGVDVIAPAPPVGAGIRLGTKAASKVDVAPVLRSVGLAEADDVIPLIRSKAGLTRLTTPFIVRDKVAGFLDSAMGRSVTQRLAGIDDYDDVARLFPKTDIDFRQAIVDAKDPQKVREILEENLGLARGLYNVQDLNLSRVRDVGRALFDNKVSRWSGLERLIQDRAGNEIALVFDDPRRATKSVQDLTNYLISLRVAPDVRNPLINRLANAITKQDENPKVILDDIAKLVIKEVSDQTRVSRSLLERMMAFESEFRDQYVFWAQYGADDLPMDFGLSDVRKGGMLGRGADGTQDIFIIPNGTAGTSAEMRRISLYLPDADRVYRATSQWSWLFETWRRAPEKFGNPNELTLLPFHLANKAWRRIVTMTGAYATRNLTESAFRAALAPGIKTTPLNPFEWIRVVVASEGFGKYLGDVEGIPFGSYADVLSKAEYDDWSDAVRSVIRENVDSSLAEKHAFRNGHWEVVTKEMDALYPGMLMDNIHLLAQDDLFRMAARRMTTDAIIDTIKSGDPEALIAVKQAQRRYSNIRLYNVTTGKYEKGTIEIIDGAGNINETNLRKFIDLYVRPRVAYNTGGTRRPDGSWVLDGDDRLMEIIANGDRLGYFTSNGRTVDAFKTSQRGTSGELIALDYSDEFDAVVREIIADPVMGPRMPIKGKARSRIDKQWIGENGKLSEAADTFSKIFFSQLFGKPDAYLHRSPVWRQYHYTKISELLDELAPGEAAKIRDAVLRGKSYNAKEDFRRLLKVRSQSPLSQILSAKRIKGGQIVYNNKTLGLDDYLTEVRSELLKAGLNTVDADARIVSLRAALTTARGTKKQVVNSILRETGRYGYGAKQLTQDEYLDMLRQRLVDLGFDDTTATNRVDTLRNVIETQPNLLTQTTNQLINEVATVVVGSERFGARWVGSKKLWKQINDRANGTIPSNGDLSAEQISQVARAFAGEQTIKTFFDAASRGNAGDVMRIVNPFHNAWAEQMKYFTRLLTQSDKKLKNGVVLIDNMRSFFYNDPVTGQPYFNYGPSDIAIPAMLALFGGGIGAVGAGLAGFGGLATAATVAGGAAVGAGAGMKVANEVADVMPQLRGPAQSLSAAFNFVPRVGPMVQIAADQVLDKFFADYKEVDAVRQYISPFGPPEGLLGAFTPSFMNKFVQSWNQDPETDTIWSQHRTDTYKVLMSSGEYDRTDPEQRDRAWAKAGRIATYLTIAQGVGQFVGPARPSVSMQIPTEFEGKIEIGDVEALVENGYVTNIVAARVFRALQEEDYDTAPQKFLEIFGENFIYSMAGRTTTEYSGIQASKEFSDWERDNPDFARTHREVYGWFAPLGDTFDKQAYLRQLNSGLRVRRTDPNKLVEDVEFMAASGMYRAFQKELSADGELTAVDRERLKKYRVQLEEYFPGYKYREQNVNRIEDQINSAILAANDTRISGNTTAEAVKAYAEHRQWAIDSANARREIAGRDPLNKFALNGNANADLRLYLRDIGELIVQQTPEFARIYDAIFYYEIDEVG